MPPGPRLSAEERALWARVTATVTPLERREHGASEPLADSETSSEGSRPSAPPAPQGTRAKRPIAVSPAAPSKPPPRASSTPPADTLDGGWDRRLRQGSVAPERTIDLHGHTLATAHAALEQALARAVADDVRLLLVVTGKPPKPGTKGRGLIRAGIGDWLGGSSYRDRIAAVRHAHPRHGGAGALYIILRRRRGE